MQAAQTLGGTFTLPGTGITLHRLGYGAMQLAGPQVWGPPKDREAALAVLREAVALGVDHIDTADFYGPHITNELIREALSPYPADLTLVTKIGYVRGQNKSWLEAASDDRLEAAVHDNLGRLGLERLPVVNFRTGGAQGPKEGSIERPLKKLEQMQQQGLIGHIGISNVTISQVRQALDLLPIVCVQNLYNLAYRADDEMIDLLAQKHIAYVPYFPLGGFTPLQSHTLTDAADALDATPMQVALAWLLARSPNLLLIPGTSSVEHLRENLKAAELDLPPQIQSALDGIGNA